MSYDLKRLRVLFEQGCSISEELKKALEPFYAASPNMFPTNLEELGISDKVKLAKSILDLFETEHHDFSRKTNREKQVDDISRL